jgi:hypothetical protein
MKFSIGDKIILNRTGEEGEVTAYINKEMVEVNVGGTLFPVYINDIDHPYLKWFTDTKKKTTVKSLPEQLPVEKKDFAKPKLTKGTYLSFLPEFKKDVFEDEVDALRVFLLNELPVSVYFQYKVLNNKQEVIFSHEGKLHAFEHIYLHTVPFEIMNEQPRFHWELTDSSNPKHAAKEDVLRIKPQKLFEHISTMLKSNEPTFSYLLTDGFAQAVMPDVFEEPIKHVKKTVHTAKNDWRESLPHFEIDLHLENITTNTRGLTNADKLQMQLNALQKHLNKVIANRQERTIIIHGLGKGVLRDEVHKLLREFPQVSKFSNEWQGRYGYGATEVWFKY